MWQNNRYGIEYQLEHLDINNSHDVSASELGSGSSYYSAKGAPGGPSEDDPGGETLTPLHATHLLQRLDEFRQEGLFCDFTLQVEHEKFKLHRAVLAGCSDYFRAMFSHGMQESNSACLELKAVSVEGVRHMVRFAYTGYLALTIETIGEILEVATFLQVPDAIEQCNQFIRTKLNFENAEMLVNLGVSFGLTQLETFYRNYMFDNFMAFTETESFLKLEAAALKDYLKQDYLNTTSETKLLKKVLEWYEYDKTNREADIYEVVDQIRFVVDGWPSIEYASEREPFLTNPKCVELMRWCHSYMANATKRYLHTSHRNRLRNAKSTIVQIGGVKGVELIDYVDGTGRRGCARNHYYHEDTHRWMPLGVISLSQPRSHSVMVEVNNFSILIGGFLFNSGHLLDQALVRHRYYTNEVKMVEPGLAMWDIPYMLTERARHAAAAVPGYIVVVGGQNESGPLSGVERLDMDKETWSDVCPLALPLYDHAAASHGNTVYISGGIQKADSNLVVGNVWSYNLKEDCWEERPSLLTGRYGHTMTRVDDQLIVCGGRPSLVSSRCLSSVESYSIETGQWTYITPMRTDCCYAAALVKDGKLLVLGGETSAGTLTDQIQEYEPSKCRWSMFGKLPHPSSNIPCCVMDVKQKKHSYDCCDSDSILDEYNFADEDDEDEDYAAWFDYEDDDEDLIDPWDFPDIPEGHIA